MLGRKGGMIKQLYLPFYLGLGGPIGKGNQFMPWIHVEDIANLLLFAIENEEVQGVLNGVAPEASLNFKVIGLSCNIFACFSHGLRHYASKKYKKK